MSGREPSTPGEWASFFRQQLKAIRRDRGQLEGLLLDLNRKLTEWDKVVALERCPKGYRHMIVSLDGLPADHEYWWTTRQRPQLRAEIADLRILQGKVEREIKKLAP
jgi:hypothetical protein